MFHNFIVHGSILNFQSNKVKYQGNLNVSLWKRCLISSALAKIGYKDRRWMELPRDCVQ
jgi:hypothetical protein